MYSGKLAVVLIVGYVAIGLVPIMLPLAWLPLCCHRLGCYVNNRLFFLKTEDIWGSGEIYRS